MASTVKPVRWVGSARVDLKAFPQEARRDVGQALYAAQRGQTYSRVKPLRGFAGASVLEMIIPHITDTYRTVYTVRFEDAIYVLHAFQKKSKRGRETPLRHIELIRRRLALAEQDSFRRKAHGEEKK